MVTAIYRSDAQCLNHRHCGHVFSDLANVRWLADDTHAYPVHPMCADAPWPLSEIGPPPQHVLAQLNDAMRRGDLLLLSALSVSDADREWADTGFYEHPRTNLR